MLKIIHEPGFNVDHARAALQELDGLFQSLAIDYCLVGGTLLACIRHGKLMPWDHDIDLLIEESDIMELAKEGRFKDYNINHYDVSDWEKADIHWFLQIEKQDILIELWPWKRMPNGSMGTTIGQFPISKALPFRRITFEGMKYPVPNDPIYFLDNALDGSDWRNKIIKRVDGHYGTMVSTENFSGRHHYRTLI